MSRTAALLRWLVIATASSQELCVMLNSDINQEMAWDYIVRDETKTAMKPGVRNVVLSTSPEPIQSQ